MKTQLLTLVLAVSSSIAVSQIPNGDFDNWTSGGTCDEPNGWNTVNGTTAILSLCTAQQETGNPYSGNAAIKITSEFRFLAGQVIPGLVSNGVIDINNQSVTGGVAFTERPTAFTGWYRAEPENNDPYSMIAVLINENTGDTVGTSIFEETSTVSNWTQFIEPVQYQNEQIPTLLQISLFSSDPSNPQDGSIVYFDELDYQSVTVDVDELAREEISIYPNPTTSEAFFSLGNRDNALVSVYNIIGVKLFEQTLSSSSNHVDLQSLAAGTYIWQLNTLNGEPIRSGKIQRIY